jgi:hypothetical protein
MKLLGSAQGVGVYYYGQYTHHTIYDDFKKAGHEGTGSYAIDSAYKVLTISTVPTTKSWVIADSTSGRVYFAYNSDGTDFNTIYLNSLVDEIDIETL